MPVGEGSEKHGIPSAVWRGASVLEWDSDLPLVPVPEPLDVIDWKPAIAGMVCRGGFSCGCVAVFAQGALEAQKEEVRRKEEEVRRKVHRRQKNREYTQNSRRRTKQFNEVLDELKGIAGDLIEILAPGLVGEECQKKYQDYQEAVECMARFDTEVKKEKYSLKDSQDRILSDDPVSSEGKCKDPRRKVEENTKIRNGLSRDIVDKAVALVEDAIKERPQIQAMLLCQKYCEAKEKYNTLSNSSGKREGAQVDEPAISEAGAAAATSVQMRPDGAAPFWRAATGKRGNRKRPAEQQGGRDFW